MLHNSLSLTMYSPLISWSRMVFLAGIVLAVVLIIPTAWFPFQLGKLALFALSIVFASVLFIAGRGVRELVHSHGFLLALFAGLLPLAYLLSAYVSGNTAVGIVGFGVEVDTALFTTIAFLAFMLSFGLFKTLRTLRLLILVLTWTLAAVVMFQWLIVLFGTSVIPFSIFSDRSLNLIGKWNDLGLVSGLLAVFLLVQAELARAPLARRVILGLGFAATALLLGVINFSLAWWLVLVLSVLIGLTSFMTGRSEDIAERDANPYAYSSWSRKVPWFSLVGALVSIVFLLYGTAINTDLTNRFPVSSLEVRPSYSSTYNVISLAREGSVTRSLIGTGPNTFNSSWIMHKPAEVNQSTFWNLDFSVGFSTLVTALGTVGLVGAVAWLVPLFLLCAGSIRAIRLSLLSREERVVALTAGLGSLFLLISIIFYVPSAIVIILAFVLSGAAFGFLWRQGRHAADEETSSPLMHFGGWAMVALLLAVSVWGAFTTDRRFVAQAMTNMGVSALQVGNADGAILQSEKAKGVEVTADAQRLAVEGGMLKIQQIANSSEASTQAAQDQFRAVVEKTIQAGKDLTLAYPNDYRSYVSLARVYDLLAALKVQGAYESAQAEYQTAIAKNPSAPDIALALARLEASQGKLELTQKYLTQSLTLKPNYTDAILFVVQLNVANNDIPSAIRAAQAAAQTAPGVAPIWFQLGLLYYASGDTKNALPALEQAVKIVPDYANAKYFLGLTYYTQGRAADALKEFEDLARSNPTSAEVNLILGNLREGKPPFESAQPPITNQPATRKTAPLNE
ncbi:MAG: Tfp pilus assembly protein PilF [Parcubacteria group bacterium Gr01-1014_56]|nr:MAG: Tfp pilus assembly protein PilF [Parcubacteria group bacterium Gr01-1014_56]